MRFHGSCSDYAQDMIGTKYFSRSGPALLYNSAPPTAQGNGIFVPGPPLQANKLSFHAKSVPAGHHRITLPPHPQVALAPLNHQHKSTAQQFCSSSFLYRLPTSSSSFDFVELSSNRSILLVRLGLRRRLSRLRQHARLGQVHLCSPLRPLHEVVPPYYRDGEVDDVHGDSAGPRQGHPEVMDSLLETLMSRAEIIHDTHPTYPNRFQSDTAYRKRWVSQYYRTA